METLAKRSIFTSGTLALIHKAERDGGVLECDAEEFVAGALETFKWHATASVSEIEYEKLLGVSRLCESQRL